MSGKIDNIEIVNFINTRMQNEFSASNKAYNFSSKLSS